MRLLDRNLDENPTAEIVVPYIQILGGPRVVRVVEVRPEGILFKITGLRIKRGVRVDTSIQPLDTELHPG